jgi:superfamily II DNA or RNA helicase
MEILDNINRLLGEDLKRSIKPSSKLRIAASCFSIYAYEALRAELEKIGSLQFIFTAPTFVPNEVTDKVRKEHREFHIPKLERERGFYGSEFEVRLKNRLTQRAIARECAEWIRRKASFRSNHSKAPMQQFACLERTGADAVYMPLHGFTAVDLGYQQGNAVSNMVNKMDEPMVAATYIGLFDQIWNDREKLQDVTALICEHIAAVYQENSPERIYFLMLYSIFSEFLEDITADVLPNDLTGYQNSLVWQKLFNFQRDAATGIINKLETYNGCILADSVGLGKTFTALAVVKYYELRNRSVLVLCPKKLSDNWTNYKGNLKTNPFSKDRFSYDVLCHTDLLRSRGHSLGLPLNRINWGNYDLVVIDESHNFRNNDAFKDRETRYQRLMNRVIKEGVKTKVLMLSATPVNNRFNDLKNQLALAYEGDPEHLAGQLKTEKNVDEIFRRAQAAFNAWSKLAPEARTPTAILATLDFDFFELLDSVTIARSRRHIQTFYDTKDIGQFPERLKPLSFRSPLTDRKDVIGFNNIFNELSLMKLAVYAPIAYILPSRLSKYEDLYDTDVKGAGTLKQKDRESSLQMLMTVNLLKRLESSVQSFRLTLERLENFHRSTLGKIASFRRTGRDGEFLDRSAAFEDTEPDEEDEFSERLDERPGEEIGGKVRIQLSDMDLPAWEHDLRADLSLIEYLLSEMRKIGPAEDAKLQHLKSHILGKLKAPINPGNRKIIVFTAFADTANYLYEQLADPLLKREGIHSARVTGAESPKSTIGRGHDFQSILTLFSPVSKEKAALLPQEPHEIDLLIATDCISEGQNLQDCDYLINYDIHWNPVRIIQRFGRIDRIGSKNACIQLVNYWPDISLDEYINLKERVENRMVIADVTATGDDNPLDSRSNDISYRKEQLRRLQDEVIELEDLKTGVSITDLGLNDFRMDLLNYVKASGELGGVPTGMHAVVPADRERGLPPGVIFALRNRHPSVNADQLNRLHPYYLVYMGADGEVIVGHTEVKRLLDLVRSACKGWSEPVPEAYQPFNAATQDGRDMHLYSNLLSRAIRSIADSKEEKELDTLFTGARTAALTSPLAGIDDFELIAFLVVHETGARSV